MSHISEELFKAWNFRHACKSFDPQFKIPAEDFNTILEAGRLSPSSFGFEPWHFLVIQNQELREQLKPLCWGAQGQLPTASHFMIILARKAAAMDPKGDYVQKTILNDTKHMPEDISKMYVEFFTNFMKNDFTYEGNDRAKFEWAARQCYIALGNMLTAAALLGYDSCPMEGFNKAEVEKLLAEKSLLDENIFGVAVMAAFGKREHEPREKTRRSQAQMIQWVE